MIAQKQVVTIATGKKLYMDMAVNLALSFLHWHDVNDINFYLFTDIPEAVPPYLRQRINVVGLPLGSLGIGFSSKLTLDKLIPEGQTIFIDSDCLIFENLSHLFERFKGKHVSVVGGYVTGGEWFGDVASICKKFNLEKIPKFNGGLYYLEKGVNTTAVYTTARELEQQYDEIGFVRLRGRPNDEVIMSVAMELHKQTPLFDDGTIMSDPQACPGGYDINVVSGKRYLINPVAGLPNHQAWYPFHKVSPAIVHFLGYYTAHYPYRREAYRLKKLSQNQLNDYAELEAQLSIVLPAKLKTGLKNMFRPLYHLLFGNRKIKASERIV